MKIDSINNNTWAEIPNSENSNGGYLGTFIGKELNEDLGLLIFRDEAGKKHFVIEIVDSKIPDIKDPNINGLKLSVKHFKFNSEDVKMFIDLECNQDEYTDEFTEIVKEIARDILVFRNDPVSTVETVIENWKSFWSSRIKDVLSEDKQIGLLCELIILKKLCEINPATALSSWQGPLRGKYDFVFSDWIFEIKATRSSSHTHWINGLDQLKVPPSKSLGLISFLLSNSKSTNSNSIKSLIDGIVTGALKNKSSLIEIFYKLLVSAGYSRIFAEEYDKLQFEIIDCMFFNVDGNFPKLTQDELNKPLSSRVSDIKYKVDLKGIDGKELSLLQLGKYFY